MEGQQHRLQSSSPLPRRYFNRVFAFIYFTAVVSLLYHRAEVLVYARNLPAFFISLSILISDVILCFMWINGQAFRMNPVVKKLFPENLSKFLKPEDFPALDIFICTADPDKEPPITVAATALSVMAYDYPVEKLSIYVSDDGGSELTLFALIEAAEFAKEWLKFCKENQILERCPDAYFANNCSSDAEYQNIETAYEEMKSRIEQVVKRGFVPNNYKIGTKALENWGKGSTVNHPSVIKVLSQNRDDKGFVDNSLPNLIYVSREKNQAIHHHFKAGALNVLLRVSSIMTNAPIILTLDCDMISNDPKTPHQMLCYFMDHSIKHNLGYVQFPVRFGGINRDDIYASELKRIFKINATGFNGLLGPDYFGTGTFFARRCFYGGPFSVSEPESPELGLDYVPSKCIDSQQILEMAHNVAGCNYENPSNWGSKIGFRYGSLVEDFYTGYRLHCEGWRSIFCDPERPVFLADMPISLHDVVTQQKRWAIGLLEVVVSKYNPMMFGRRFLGQLMAHGYSFYAFGPFLSFPITIYSCLPQVTMLNNISIFPKVSEWWFFVYVCLFVGAYGQDLLEFLLVKSTFSKWWNDQRMWLIRGLTSDLFGVLEYVSSHLGMAARVFNVTSKVNDIEQRKRYEEGEFEFGVASPMFVLLCTAAILNLSAVVSGGFKVFYLMEFDDFTAQMLLTCFGFVNCLPLYKAMFLRRDEGRMPIRITAISIFLAWVIFLVVSFLPILNVK